MFRDEVNDALMKAQLYLNRMMFLFLGCFNDSGADPKFRICEKLFKLTRG